MQNTISLTDAAVKQLKKLCAKEHGHGLYINIKTTGCSGYSYDLSIVDQAKPDDLVFPQVDELFVAVSQKNLPFVSGSTIDYVREGLNAHFKFLNPNEKGTCGCGESFNL